jgi:hypothetical protein
MGQAGREAVAKSFTWDVIARKTIEVYGSLVETERPRVEVTVMVGRRKKKVKPVAPARALAENKKKQSQRRKPVSRKRSAA